MRRPIAIVFLLSACLCRLTSTGDAQCRASWDAIPLCTVLSGPAKYDGKEITVRGVYRMVIHGSILTSPMCPQSYVNMRGAADYKADEHALGTIRSLTKKNQFESVDVVLRGTFHVAREGQCFGQNCLRYEIEDHELLCATAISETGRLVGVVHSDHSLGSLRISIGKASDTAATQAAELNKNGEFEFDAVAPGEYVVNVTNLNRCLEYTTTVKIKGGTTVRVSIGRAQKLRPNLCE